MSVLRLVGNHSVTVLQLAFDLKIVLVLSATTATNWKQVAHQSPNNPWPPSNHQKSFYIKLVTERFHLQQVKPPCNQIVLVTFLWPLQPVFDFLATARNHGCREVTDQLQAMHDWGLNSMQLPLNWGHRWAIIPDIKLLMWLLIHVIILVSPC